ncbi:MAG: RNA polymerase sigma factor [Thermodesulfovibrionales bacterium]
MDDRQLIEEYLSGDEDAIEGIITKYRKMIYSLAFRLTNNMETAKDITQETFIKAMQGLRKFRMDASLKTWLYRIATNISLNHLRKKEPETIDVDGTIVRSEPLVLTSMIKKEKDDYLARALLMLPKRQRIAVTLRTAEGLSCKETAAVMDCSEGAVKAHYHNGVKKLKAIIKELGYENGSS